MTRAAMIGGQVLESGGAGHASRQVVLTVVLPMFGSGDDEPVAPMLTVPSEVGWTAMAAVAMVLSANRRDSS